MYFWRKIQQSYNRIFGINRLSKDHPDFLVITSIIINLEDWFSTVFLTSKLIIDFEKNTEIYQMGGRRIQQEVTIVLAW